MRRGNSVVEIQDEHGDRSYHMGRKGLMKFFDMRLSYISREERDQLQTNNEEHQAEKNYIMAPVLRAIRQGHRVEVFKTLKANGENVQLSYSKEARAWIICSKNVAILCNTAAQARQYLEGP